MSGPATEQHWQMWEGQHLELLIPVTDTAGDPQPMTAFTAAIAYDDQLLTVSGGEVTIVNHQATDDALLVKLTPTHAAGRAGRSWPWQAWVTDDTGQDVPVAVGTARFHPDLRP